jgi:uncharacterized RDD family membrane protein YckC
MTSQNIFRRMALAPPHYYHRAMTTPPRPYSNIPSPDQSHQPALRYASFQHRLGAYALDCVLAVLTLGIGWTIWAMIAWGEGQTPAKKILKLRTINATNGRPASWGHMALREFLVPSAVGIASLLTSGLAWIAWIVLEIVMYFNQGGRTLRDLWVKTAIVNEA